MRHIRWMGRRIPGLILIAGVGNARRGGQSPRRSSVDSGESPGLPGSAIHSAINIAWMKSVPTASACDRAIAGQATGPSRLRVPWR